MFETLWAIFIMVVALINFWICGLNIEAKNYSMGLFNFGIAVVNLGLFFILMGGLN